MPEETYRFTHVLGMGRGVQLFYVPASWPGSKYRRLDQGQFFTVSSLRCDEIEASAPQGLLKSTFRIVREYERHVDLEWT